MNKVFAYCERGLDPGFWAEPLNALSNAAFLIAALVALMDWQRWRHDFSGTPRPCGTEVALVALVAVIGAGSFLFHTLATRWAMLADVIPISLFMFAYLGYALRHFVGLGWFSTLAGLVAFFALSSYAEGIDCGGKPCLNGSIGYLPAFAALALVGLVLAVRKHAAAGFVLVGAAVFAVSLTLRTLDRSICPQTALFAGRVLGTHFLWHMLNATLLYLLLRAAILHGGRARAVPIAADRRESA